MLPHPSFVYASEINGQKSVIATGCYDKVVRVWKSGSRDQSWGLFQELEGHKGYVRCLCFSKRGDVLYSADSVGAIFEWSLDERSSWCLKRFVCTNVIKSGNCFYAFMYLFTIMLGYYLVKKKYIDFEFLTKKINLNFCHFYL